MEIVPSTALTSLIIREELTLGKTIADSLDLRRDWFEPSHHVAATQNHGRPNRLYSR